MCEQNFALLQVCPVKKIMGLVSAKSETAITGKIYPGVSKKSSLKRFFF